jgi:hypothetical protein
MAETTKPQDNTAAGLIAMGAGIFVALMVHFSPESGDAPGWVGDVAAAAFFFAGLSIVAAPRGWTLLAKLSGLAAGYALVVPGAWIVLAGDTNKCSGGFSLGGLGFGDIAPGLMCRAAFGLGTLIALLIVIALTWSAFRRKP